MKKFALIGFALAASLAATASATGPAQAQCCVAYDRAHVNETGNNIISQLSERINAMQLAIIEAMRLGTGQLSGNLKEQIGSDSSIANVQDDRAVVGRVEAARFDAIRSATSGASTCNVVTGARGQSGVDQSAAATRTALSQQMSDWDLGSGDSPSAQGGDVAVQQRIARHCALYANQDDVTSGLCPTVRGLRNASIDIAQSLFYQTPGTSGRTLSPDREQAASLFMINAINPNPQGAMLRDAATSPGGREVAARRHANSARLSVAQEAVSDIFARRRATDSQEVQNWAMATAQQIPGYNPDFTQGVSAFDVMDVRAKAFLLNPNLMIGKDMTVEQATKDMANMMATLVHQNWEMFQVQERQMMILATLLAIQTENSRTNPVQTGN